MNLKATAVLESVAMPAIESARELAYDRTIAIPLKGRVSLYCLSGSLWATLDKEGEDILVEAGQTRVIEGRGRLVISALKDSKLYVG
ncbi:MAG TPA: DUF2917 domain-containing protein [Rectinemataceae bacterium]|nr:DUF2917 domain-containing protein [Rectinemataceae bacterium]